MNALVPIVWSLVPIVFTGVVLALVLLVARQNRLRRLAVRRSVRFEGGALTTLKPEHTDTA